jgi:hypothetical protein
MEQVPPLYIYLKNNVLKFREMKSKKSFSIFSLCIFIFTKMVDGKCMFSLLL